jgi:hypothetical protein
VAEEHYYGADVLVTRKGAIRAAGDLGIIPGSMGGPYVGSASRSAVRDVVMWLSARWSHITFSNVYWPLPGRGALHDQSPGGTVEQVPQADWENPARACDCR